jgi:acetyl/propionyl-CoA carboxylase alpha subunit
LPNKDCKKKTTTSVQRPPTQGGILRAGATLQSGSAIDNAHPPHRKVASPAAGDARGPLAFRSVLIANRGEIAVRIIRTLRKLGLEACIAYHAIDKNTPAVAMADRAVEIEAESPITAYLDGAQILRAARAIGADAIHPGYGFLSENAAFAEATVDAGLIFIGPPAETIALMGDKIRARALAAASGIPVAPSAIEEEYPAGFVDQIRALGAPVLIKPAAGGGGKGMRIVRDLSLLEDEIQRARSEALRYFGDGRLFAERYIERPRHIEVQILADAYGNTVHLFERECSLQRRFQKVVEESPSPSLTKEQRSAICAAAVRIAKVSGYRNAGTVEFVCGDNEFFFLEVNTRLQVEHAVTEMITGLDLVSEQLRIAAGQALGYEQADVRTAGHAIEARIYAEDASRDFLPTTGPVLALQIPEGAGIRVDIGIAEGQTINAAFDPMLAKVIAHGRDRADALEALRMALAEFVLLGCKTNSAFLRRLLNDADVRCGHMHTGLIAEKTDLLHEPEISGETARKLLAAAMLSCREVRDAAEAIPAIHAEMNAWRN